MNPKEIKKAARLFVERWQDKGSERAHSQSFWLDLLGNVYGIENPVEYISFEHSFDNMMDSTSFLDGYIEKTSVLIEQKGVTKDLNKGIKQSDGSFLTPIQQATRYSASLPYSKRPRWIITCNFREFYIYDMEKPNSMPSTIRLLDLPTEYYRLEILLDKTNTQIEKETEISVKAGEIIGEIYTELLNQYKNPNDENTLKSINQLCVRLVFCFYAEDAGLFGNHSMFHDYLSQHETRYFRTAIISLFEVLNTPINERDPYIDDSLNIFPYVNGGLFEDTHIEIPQFTEELRQLILKHASSDFDWSEISPTIFGGLFESTLNPEQRHDGGMHYTSIENIHKIIDPLFLNDLKDELNEIKQYKQYSKIKSRALKFQNKLSNLIFLDPACGSGNFLTETYLSLRELENEALSLIIGDSPLLDIEIIPIKVRINQFYGIEINDFAVSVAKTALWIAESQMFEKTETLIYANDDFLPLKSYVNIVEGNALQLDWNQIVDVNKLNYVIGNPPFLGYKKQKINQKEDLEPLFGKTKAIDYVAGWFYKASQFIENTDVKVAFVSTSSICQGEQVEKIWGVLFNQFDIKIDFAYQSFKWQNETKNSAAVHCVIVGFSYKTTEVKTKVIYRSINSYTIAQNINPYLLDAPTIFIKNRTKPISNVEIMNYGSEPREGGNLILSIDEKNALISESPFMQKYIHRFVSAKDYIDNKYRYCLWLVDADLSEIKKSKITMDRLKATKEFRLHSKQKQAYKSAETPYLFTSIRQPKTEYLLIPITTSENRKYIPIGYVDKDVIASNACNTISNASLHTFGIMTSNMHMAWMRTIAGRLKSDYRYSSSIVYNNYPWPKINDETKNEISETAKKILDVRKKYKNSTLGDLYNELIMPVELRKAHQENDKAVMTAYGLPIGKTTETDAVSHLFRLYETMI